MYRKRLMSTKIIILLILSLLVGCREVSMNPQKDPMTTEFLDKYSDYFHTDWLPSEILNFAEDNEFRIKDEEFTIEDLKNPIMGYIRKVGKDAIKVDEILWIIDSKEPNGFRIEDANNDIEEYKLDVDCPIWFLSGSATRYRVPLVDLKSYFKEHDYKSKVWHFLIEDDKIVFIAEQYIP